jgi:hypothetical protein
MDQEANVLFCIHGWMTHLIAEIFGIRRNIVRNLQLLLKNGIHCFLPVTSIKRCLKMKTRKGE